MEDDVFRGAVKVKIVSLIICGTMEELIGCSERMLKIEEALQGLLIILEAQYPNIDYLKISVYQSALYQLKYLALKLLDFCASFHLI